MTRLFEENKNQPLEKIQSVLTTEAITIHREDIEINQTNRKAWTATPL